MFNEFNAVQLTNPQLATGSKMFTAKRKFPRINQHYISQNAAIPKNTLTSKMKHPKTSF